MCGIVGYFGNKQAFDVLIKGIKKLEYRGYDSFGISILSPDLTCITTQKETGKQNNFVFKEINGTIGIAHTRWATHGKVSKENAHPHTDCKDEISVVHNGIIENYKYIKQELENKGHIFKSETDTEIIPHLIEDHIKNGHSLESSFAISISEIEGDFSILVIKKQENKLLGARKGALPLCIGISDDDIFPASDVLAFTEYTNKAIFLKSGDIFIKDNNGLYIYNVDNFKKVERNIETIVYNSKDTSLGVHEHYFIKEISEQSETLMNAINQDVSTINKACELIKKSENIFFVGCGSSYNACVVAFYLFSEISNYKITPIIASEYKSFEKLFNKKSVVVAISQSGETADILSAVKSAKEKGSKIISIINRENSILSKTSDLVLYNGCGTEICVLSTKSYTTQIAIIFLIAHALSNKYEEGINKIRNLYVDVFNLTSTTMREQIKKIAELIYKHNDLYIIGRGVQYPTALEAALKIKEVSYIHAEAFAGGELKHGNLALISDNIPCIVLMPSHTPSSTYPDMNLNESKAISDTEIIKSRGGTVIGIGYSREHTFDYWIKVPDVNELNAILQIIPMQLLAYELAILKHLDPDKPRNLAKSVTVS